MRSDMALMRCFAWFRGNACRKVPTAACATACSPASGTWRVSRRARLSIGPESRAKNFWQPSAGRACAVTVSRSTRASVTRSIAPG